MTSVYLKLPYGLRSTDGTRGVWCEADTVCAVLAALLDMHPSLQTQVYGSDGSLRMTVILNGLEVTDSESMTLQPGDHLSLLPHRSHDWDGG
jgi:hypothetical protein